MEERNVTLNLETPVSELMSRDIKYVSPDTSFTEIDRIFGKCNFHHLPVVNNEGSPVGMISKNDYHKLQHHFTIFNYKEAKRKNEILFESLIAEEVMVPHPICIPSTATIKKALNMFQVNLFHAIVVTEEDRIVGIITPFDFLEYLNDL